MFSPAYRASDNRCPLPVNVILNPNTFPSPRVKAHDGNTSSYWTDNWRTRRTVEHVQSHCGRVSTYYCRGNVKYTVTEKTRHIPATIVGFVRLFYFFAFHRPVSKASGFSFFFHYFSRFLLIFLYIFLSPRDRHPYPNTGESHAGRRHDGHTHVRHR